MVASTNSAGTVPIEFTIEDREDMNCGNNSSSYGPQPLWSKKDDTNWNSHAMGAPQSTTGLKKVRGSIENRSSSGAAKSRIAYRFSNDGATWQGWTPLYAPGTNEQSNDGTTYGSTFVDLTSTAAGWQLIQWGAQVINTSGTATELVTTTIKIDKGD